jgi:hypothetical protein
MDSAERYAVMSLLSARMADAGLVPLQPAAKSSAD